MEFISAEEFLEQDEKVIQMFLDWWKPSVGDLYRWISNSTFEDVQVLNKSAIDTFKYDEFINFKKDCIPLLTEGQLRKFIEDKTNCHIEIIVGISGYVFVLRSKETLKEEKRISVLKRDLLQAYWKVAIQIAKES